MASTLGSDTVTTANLSDGTNSTSSTNPIRGSAKAWVKFYGLSTASINGSYNVSSVTRNGTGDYTINFTKAFANSNYSTSIGNLASGQDNGSGRISVFFHSQATYTASSVRLVAMWNGDGATKEDLQIVCASCFA